MQGDLIVHDGGAVETLIKFHSGILTCPISPVRT